MFFFTIYQIWKYNYLFSFDPLCLVLIYTKFKKNKREIITYDLKLSRYKNFEILKLSSRKCELKVIPKKKELTELKKKVNNLNHIKYLFTNK